MSQEPKRVPIAKPLLGEEESEAATRVIRSGWVTQGPETGAFEEEFAAYTGAPHACAVSSCTAALHLALLGAGAAPGGEVITVSHTFIATANAVRYCGAVPVFVDVEPDTFNIDPHQIERAITPRTKIILAVHQMGMPCALGEILPIARKHGLKVVEDAACAAGSEVRPRRTLGKDRETARRRGLFLFSSPQGDHHRRRRHDHLRRSRTRCPIPPVAAARHEHPRYRTPPCRRNPLRVLPRPRLQLPSHRHPSRGRPRTTPPSAGDPRRTPCPSPQVSRPSPGNPRPNPAPRTRLGPEQLAKLLRSSSPRRQPAPSHAIPPRPGRCHPPGHHVHPPRSQLHRRPHAPAAAPIRSRAGSYPSPPPLPRTRRRNTTPSRSSSARRPRVRSAAYCS